jgi:hypothetical protein
VTHDDDRRSGLRQYSSVCLALTVLAICLLAGPVAAQDRAPDALTTAQSMRKAGATATTVARQIRVDFRSTALVARDVLKTVGFNAVEITGALRDEFRIAGVDMYDALKGAGYPSTTIRDALDRNGIRVDMNCIDPQGFPVPCGNFGGNAAQPVMGQLTWTPADQGTVNGTLTITGSNIPQVDVRIGNQVLNVVSSSSTTVVAALPGSPVSGALTLRRASDGVIGELAPSYAVVQAPEPEATLNWAGFATAASDAAIEAARVWLSGARILASSCKVVGVSAIGSPGVFASAQSFGTRIRSALIAEGAPWDLANAWNQAFTDAWQSWSSAVTIPGIPVFPSFSAFPGPQAPPTPSLPMPLVAMLSGRLADMSPPAMANRVTMAIGADATNSGASAAISTFATLVGARFAVFLATAQVMMHGSGPVPSYDPPATMLGTVTGGTCEGENVVPNWATF